MSKDTSSVTSTDMAVDDVFASIDKIKENKHTSMGITHYTVSPRALDSLTRRVQRLLATSENTSPEFKDRLIKANEKLEAVNQENDVLKKRIASMEITSKEQIQRLQEAHAYLESKLKLHLDSEKEAKKERNGLLQKLSAAKLDLDGQKSLVAKLEKGFDPEALKQSLEAKEKLVLEVTRLNAELAKINSQQKARDDSLAKSRATVAQLEAEKNMTNKRLEELRAALNNSTLPESELVFSETMVSLLGQKATQALRDMMSIAHEDVKQRSFAIASALEKTKSKQLKGLAKLFWAIVDWCKKQTYRARKVLVGFVDLVLRDITAGSIKAISFYRDELAKIIEVKTELVALRKQQKKSSTPKNEYGKTETFWEDAYFTSWAIWLRLRRQSQNLIARGWNGLKSFWTFIKSTVHGKTMGRFFKSKESVEDYTSIDEILDERRDGNGTGGAWLSTTLLRRRNKGRRQTQEPIIMFDATKVGTDETGDLDVVVPTSS